MAENKTYITHTQENGQVMISEDVIFTISDHAIHEVEGVIGLSSKPVGDLSDRIGKKAWNKGIRITLGEDEHLTVDCNVIIAYGQSVVSVAQAIQEAVTASLESMTGVKVTGVNVNVCGIGQK